jgi:hypothetical protein
MDVEQSTLQLSVVGPDYSKPVISALEELMESARNGQLRGFTMVGRVAGGDTVRIRVGELNYKDVIAECELIKFDAIRQWFPEDL